MKKIFTISLLLAVFCASGVLKAQTKTWTGVTEDGLWSTPGNWDPIGVPDAGDDVVIPQGVTSYVEITSPSECKSLLMNNNGSSSAAMLLYISVNSHLLVHENLTIKGSFEAVDRVKIEIKSEIIFDESDNPEERAHLKILRDLIFDAPAGKAELSAMELGANATLEIGGDALFVNGAGKLTSGPTNTITFNGSGDQYIDADVGGGTMYSNLVIDKPSGIARFYREIPAYSIRESLYIKNGTLTDNGKVLNTPYQAVLTMDSGTRLIFERINDGQIFPEFSGFDLDNGAIIEFAGIGIQEITLEVGANNPSLEVSGSGNKIIRRNISVQDLTIGKDVILDNSSSKIAIFGDLDIDNEGALTLGLTSTMEFAGANQNLNLPGNFKPSLILSGSGTKTMTGNISVHNLIIATGVTFAGSNDTLKIFGEISNSGTLALGNNATIEFAGGNQNVAIPDQSPNLVLSGTGTKTLTGDITVQNLSVGESVTMKGNDKTITILKVLSNDVGSQFNYGSSTILKFAGIGTQNINIPAGLGGGSPNLVLSGSGTKTLNNNISVQDLSVETGATLVANSKTLTILKEFKNSGGGYNLDASSTLIFAGIPSQNVFVPDGQSPNLTLSGSSVKTLVGDVRIQDLDVMEGTVLLVNNDLTLAILGTLSNAGNFILSENFTLEFGGANQSVFIPNSQKPNLMLSGTGNKMLTENIAVNNLTINSGTQFSAQAFTINLKGNFVNGGTFNAVSSSLNVRGENSQITGVSQLHSLTVESDANLLPIETLSLSGKLNVFGTADFSLSSLTFNGGGAFEVSGVSSVKNLELNKSGTITLTEPLSLSGVLTLTNGTLVSNGNLTVDLNTGYVSTSSGGIVTGDVTFKKTVAHEKSSFLSAPLSTLASDFGAPVSIYNEGKTSGRYELINGNSFIGPNGVGYSVNYGATIPTVGLTGTFNNTLETTSVTIKSTKSNGSTRAGWNIIGNPYAHDLDWDAIIDQEDEIGEESQIYSGIYYYIGNDNYTTYVRGIPEGDNLIPSMQGVMVYLHNSTAGDVSYSLELPRTAGKESTNSLKRSAPITDVLKLSVTNGQDKDATYIRLSDEATLAFDKSLDAYKMKNGGITTPNLYTYNSTDIFSINSVPASFNQYSLPLAFEAKVSGEYTINLSEEYEYTLGYSITLEDRKLQTLIHIGDVREYTFMASTSDNAGRFVLHFNSPVVTGTSYSSLSQNVKVFVSNQDLILASNRLEQKATVAIFDLSGILVAKYENVDLASGRVTLSAPKQKGMYIVNVTSSEIVSSEKVIIN
jgi:hypothetical protein